jgi:caffeic acid 3-O-methyltransferase
VVRYTAVAGKGSMAPTSESMAPAVAANGGSIWQHQLSEEEMITAQTVAIPMMMGFVTPFVMRSAVLLGLPDIIAGAGPGKSLTLEQIAAALNTTRSNNNVDGSAAGSTPVNKSNLQRLLNYMVASGILSCSKKVQYDDPQSELVIGAAAADHDSDHLQYGLTAVSDLLVTKNNPSTQAPMLLLHTSGAAQASWAQLHCSVFGENPCRTAHGKNVWEYSRDNPEFNRTVNAAMAASVAMLSSGLNKYEGFKHIKTLVDVGGGVGKALGILVSSYPQMHGINFDQPHVVADAPNIPGVQHVGGNMFESIPSGDAIFLKFILHNWGDDDCIKVLKNCKKALPENGKVLIYELVIDTNGQWAQMMDIMMLTHFESGMERTEKHWRRLIAAAGFSSVNFIELNHEHCLIEVSN